MKILSSSSFVLRLAAAGACSALTFAARADIVVDWNTQITQVCEVLPPPGLPPFLESRAYAIIHIAMRDAMSVASKSPGANVTAAAIQAGHDTAVALLPMGTAAFDTLLAAGLANLAGEPGVAAGTGIGSSIAAALLASRAN